jgi:predicted short-subunit dehydrogenase-like oxidoreductase (DUF2520 family)
MSKPLHRTLTIIGCGNVGKTLARLWVSNRTLTVLDVLNRTTESAQRAISFIGAGCAASDYANLRPADIYMIATPDDRIAACCDELARAGYLSADTVVFHCSGALPSIELRSAIREGASVASIHPIRSFAVPEQVAQNFSGTYCGVEGDPHALAILGEAFSGIGAELVPIQAVSKTLYHSAAVFACNYLPTLLDVAQEAYVKSGIPSDIALKLMEPLVRETIDNIFRLGPANALSGPIARGDMVMVEKQQHAVAAWDRQYGDLYQQFVTLTLALAASRNKPHT